MDALDARAAHLVCHVTSIFVAGVDQGICFTNLAGNTVYPAVAFYSTGRQVTLLKVEGPSSSGGSVAADVQLDSLDEVASVVGFGELGKGGELGYESKKVKLNGSNVSSALSMHPPANEGNDDEDEDAEGGDAGERKDSFAYATYKVDKAFQTFTGSVAINGDVDAEKLASKGSPTTFVILADGQPIWTSEPVTKPNEEQKVRARS